MAGKKAAAGEGGRPKCPACGKPREERFRPFCSARCRDSDLLNWLDGRYAIPAQEVEPDDGDEGPGEPGRA